MRSTEPGLTLCQAGLSPFLGKKVIEYNYEKYRNKNLGVPWTQDS